MKNKRRKKFDPKKEAHLGAIDLLLGAILVLVGDGVEDLGLDILGLGLGLRLSGVRASLSALFRLFLLSVRGSSGVGESSRRLRERLSGLSDTSAVVRRLTVGDTRREVRRGGRGSIGTDVGSSGSSLGLLSVVSSVGDVLRSLGTFLLNFLLLALSFFLQTLGFVALGGEASVGNVRGVVADFTVGANPLLVIGMSVRG